MWYELREAEGRVFFFSQEKNLAAAPQERRRAPDAPEAPVSARGGDMSELQKPHRKCFLLPHRLETFDPATFFQDRYSAHWHAVEPLRSADPSASPVSHVL